MSLSTTTLSIAIGGPPSGINSAIPGPIFVVVTPASMTNIVAPGPNKQNRTILWIDREAFEVVSVTTTTATCVRAVWGTLQTPHSVGATIYVGKESDFSSFLQDTAGLGLGLKDSMAVSIELCHPVTLNTAADSTLLPEQMLAGQIEMDPNGAGRTVTTPTATDIITALQARCRPQIGTSFQFDITNTADASETLTLSAGVGVTLSPTSQAIAQNNSKRFKVVVTDPVTPAVTIYSLGTATT